MNDICAIGFGEIGQDIAQNLVQYGVYDVFAVLSPDEPEVEGVERIEIDIGDNTGKYAHEAYDDWFDTNTLEVPSGYKQYVLFVSGKSDISGTILRIAAQIKEKDIEVVYVHPDANFMSNIEQMQEKVSFYVLQEYARSANLKQLLLFDMNSIEAHMKNLSIKNYFSDINAFIANFYHSWKWCENNKALLGVFPETIEHARIGTLGVIGENGEEFIFFPLKSFDDEVPYPSDVRYYYLLGGAKLEEDMNLLSEIKKSITKKSENFNTTGYGIYEVDEDHETTLIFMKTAKIQKL